jgi:hypothetical protein
MGRIPKGWEVANLQRFLDGPPKNGHSPTAVAEWTGRVMLGLGCLSDEGFVPVQLKNAPRHDARLDAVVGDVGQDTEPHSASNLFRSEVLGACGFPQTP